VSGVVPDGAAQATNAPSEKGSPRGVNDSLWWALPLTTAKETGLRENRPSSNRLGNKLVTPLTGA